MTSPLPFHNRDLPWMETLEAALTRLTEPELPGRQALVSHLLWMVQAVHVRHHNDLLPWWTCPVSMCADTAALLQPRSGR